MTKSEQQALLMQDTESLHQVQQCYPRCCTGDSLCDNKDKFAALYTKPALPFSELMSVFLS